MFYVSDDKGLYGFIRVIAGDELSKRPKFVLIMWIGSEVSAPLAAKMTLGKTHVKSIIKVCDNCLFLTPEVLQMIGVGILWTVEFRHFRTDHTMRAAERVWAVRPLVWALTPS